MLFPNPSGHKPTKCLWTEEEELRQSCELRGNEAIDLQFRRQNYCFFGTWQNFWHNRKMPINQ